MNAVAPMPSQLLFKREQISEYEMMNSKNALFFLASSHCHSTLEKSEIGDKEKIKASALGQSHGKIGGKIMINDSSEVA